MALTSLLDGLFSSGGFMSHGHCYMWNPSLVRLHVVSDLLIGIAYVAISLTLWRLVRRAKSDMPFHWMFIAFGMFIIACGATHFMEVWTIWTPTYWLSGTIKAITAAASVVTAIALPPLVPKSLNMLGAAQLSEDRKGDLEAANTLLQNEAADRKRAEEEVRHLNQMLEMRVLERTKELEAANEALAQQADIVEHSNDAIFSRTLGGEITSWNGAAERLYGYPASEIVGKNVRVLFPPDVSSNPNLAFAATPSPHEAEPLETAARRKDGERIEVSLTISPIFDGKGVKKGASIIGRDVTERRRAESQLRETQKLESLGVIAGGVAHDFNNLLVGILGNASIVLDSLDPTSVNYECLQTVVDAGEKASHLTRQLLAYAGKGRFVTEAVDLSLLVREISALVQTSIPKNVRLKLELAPDLPAIQADPSQLQQVIMNLVINGAEAVPGARTGIVAVTTDAQQVDSDFLRLNFGGEALPTGRYISLTVNDTGSGMTEDVRDRIFDPFFTTKFTGRGLGLAAVLGIVRGHKGAIRVDSRPGEGTTFRVLLPAAATEIDAGRNREKSSDCSGTGTILVVDDEQLVRVTCKAGLERFGYNVLLAPDGQAGVELYRERASEIRVVILDMTMPVMGGEEAFEHLRQIRPDAKIVLSSGYNEVEAIRRFTALGITAFLQKPYTAAKLGQLLKRVLDRD